MAGFKHYNKKLIYQGGGPKYPSFIENFKYKGDYDTLLNTIITDKGGAPEDYRNLMDSIAYHESMGTMSPTIKQLGGGPGRGKYQFEIGNNAGAYTAAKRTADYYKAKGLALPSWLEDSLSKKSLDASTLNPYQQDILFLGNMRMHPKADLGKVVSGKESIEDFWANYHWAGPKSQRNQRINSFRSSMDKFSKANGGPKQDNNMDDLLTYIQAGGTHQQNPLGGVPIGGRNLAEEGETMTKDYVFSDRIKLDEGTLKKYKLPLRRLKGKTVAQASKELNKILEETNDPIDRASTTEMLERLKAANEELRPQTELPSTTEHAMNPDMQLPPKELQGGGEKVGYLDGFLGKETFGQDAAGLAGMAGTAFGLGMNAFGDTGIDTTGQSSYNEQPNIGLGAASGALSGASAGAILGPVGAAVGGVLGGVAGLIGGNKKKKDMQEANYNHALAQNAQYRDMAMGGYLDEEAILKACGGKRKMHYGGGKAHTHPNSFEEMNRIVMEGSYNFQPPKPRYRLPINMDSNVPSYRYSQADPNNIYGDNDWQGAVGSFDPGQEVSAFTNTASTAPSPSYSKGAVSGTNSTGPVIPEINIPKGMFDNPYANTPLIKTLPVADVTPRNESETTPRDRRREQWDNTKDKLENIGNTAMRFAPVLTNYLQYKNMKKPEVESLDRIDRKYKPNYVDEASLVNQVREQEGTTRRALKEASGGDAGALRANLLMSHLNAVKGRSQAFMQAENMNREENARKQQFDLQGDIYNLRQGNLESDMNARNRAAYENNRSRFLSQIGQDIGNIGLENRRMKYPEWMGLDYNTQGEFIAYLEQKRKEAQEAKAAKKSKG